MTYRLDAEDRIIEVGGAWDAFATANDGSSVLTTRILGRSIWDYVTGSSTILLWRELLAHVRQERTGVYFPFRCDSPRRRRYMRMLVVPAQDDRVLLHSQLVREEPRRLPLHIGTRSDSPPTVRRCSLCNMLKVRGLWTDVVDAVEIGLVMDHDRPVIVAYDVCPGCRNVMRLAAQPPDGPLKTDGTDLHFSSPLRSTATPIQPPTNTSRPQPQRPPDA